MCNCERNKIYNINKQNNFDLEVEHGDGAQKSNG